VEGDGANNATPRLEIHFFGLDTDLYHQVLEVEFVSFLRPEKRFPSLEGLRLQIHEDAENAKKSLLQMAQTHDEQ
jgi:riboflavin kinase/FMN adenylyltransferase